MSVFHITLISYYFSYYFRYMNIDFDSMIIVEKLITDLIPILTNHTICDPSSLLTTKITKEILTRNHLRQLMEPIGSVS